MKLCPCCENTKPLLAFSTRPNGRPQSHCKACDNARAAAWQKANKDKAKAASQRYDASHRAERQAAAKANRDANRKAVSQWRETNREKHRAAVAAWYKANPAKARAHEAKRRAVKLNAVPSWASCEAIANIYARAAQLRKEGHNVHVDHDFPLQGKTVCGLHVETNLRIVPAGFNLAKSNKFAPSDLQTI